MELLWASLLLLLVPYSTSPEFARSQQTSIALFLVLSAPFVVIVVLSPFRWASLGHMVFASSSAPVDLFGGLLVAIWNYMGWDNASTVAGEVDRPQRTYPRAMLMCVGLVALTYILPVAAVAITKLNPSAWETGSWVNIATLIGGPLLGVAVVLGGMMSAFGMFNALVMSYSRLPLAMAQDRMLPAAFGRLTKKSRIPWVAIVVLSAGWALCVGLGFERLVAIDILIYGSSLLLEFAALVVLRIREPNLPRPFRVPGGLPGAVLVGVFPGLLLGLALLRAEHEQVLGLSSRTFGILVILAGFLAYGLRAAFRSSREPARSSTGGN